MKDVRHDAAETTDPAEQPTWWHEHPTLGGIHPLDVEGGMTFTDWVFVIAGGGTLAAVLFFGGYAAGRLSGL